MSAYFPKYHINNNRQLFLLKMFSNRTYKDYINEQKIKYGLENLCINYYEGLPEHRYVQIFAPAT
jgi:hypothetical protein